MGKKFGFKIVHQNYFDLDFVLAILLRNTAELTHSNMGVNKNTSTEL